MRPTERRTQQQRHCDSLCLEIGLVVHLHDLD